MTKIPIAPLREGENSYSNRLPAEELDLKIEEGTVVGEVEIQGIITKSLPHLSFVGTLGFRVDFECARCVKSFLREFRVPARNRYQQVDEIRPGWEVAADVRFIPTSAHELDILPEVREGVAFSVPHVPLCHEECPGLCPRCGADLSMRMCECKSLERDTPWEALKHLKTI